MGKAVPGKPGAFFASLEGQPFVFTLTAAAIQPLLAEFHETQVMSFSVEAVRRVVFRTPVRTLAFQRSLLPRGGPADWIADAGTDASGIDLSRFSDLVKQLSQLRTTGFAQYKGPIPASTGLAHPRLVLEVQTGDGKLPQILRLGESQGPLLFATTGTSSAGPVFFLPAIAWNALIQSLGPGQELPDDVFAP